MRASPHSGPKKAPQKLRLLKSVDGIHDSSWRKIEQMPPFKRYCPEKPDDLSPEAAKHWDEVTPELIRADLLTQHNIGGLVLLCETWARWKIAQKEWVAEGSQLVTSKGYKNPVTTILLETGNQYLRLAVEFGLTPSSETRLGSKDLEQQPSRANPFAERPEDIRRGTVVP